MTHLTKKTSKTAKWKAHLCKSPFREDDFSSKFGCRQAAGSFMSRITTRAPYDQAERSRSRSRI